jgi:alkylation response protein AidB-like acyl-CoA dehydrogenase
MPAVQLPRWARRRLDGALANAVDGLYGVLRETEVEAETLRNLPDGAVEAIRHSAWVQGGFRLAERAGDDPTGWYVCVVPKDSVKVLDNWYVAGSGSYDYGLEAVFVPEGYWFDFLNPAQLRGGPQSSAPIRIQLTAAHTGFALGLAERAMDEIAGLAVTKRRQYATGGLAERGAFQRDLGHAHVQVNAARDHAARLFDELERRQHHGGPFSALAHGEIRAAGTYATEVAVDTAGMALPYAGGSGIRFSSPFQRVMRDILVAQSHIHVADTDYDALGTLLVTEG